MNAPDTPLQQIALLPIDELQPSPTNPRKRFDEAKLNELANSIKAIGIAQPLLVRDMHGAGLVPGAYEIVAGERRYRAATIAGLDQVPCYVRDLTDHQVLHIQLIENLQRDDLHPIEEAEGYERLLQEKDAVGNPYTADSIAAEIGKSRSYVFQRRKLLALCPDAREAFYAGKLDASTALLIARIPVEKLQLQALKKLTEEAGWSNQFLATGDKMTFRRARELVQDEFMLDLDRAAFDPKDADLLPKAGACATCLKRTGNAPDLFDDVKDANVCTDTVCFGMKKTAHVLKLQKEAEASGAEVIKGKEAKKLIPTTKEKHMTETFAIPHLNDGETYAGAIVNPDGTGHHTILLPGDNDNATWEKQMEWVKSIGGDLPDCVEQAMLYKHLSEQFKKDWYWSNTQRESGSAWTQSFLNGNQVWGDTDNELRARAVRRVAIQ